MNKLLTIDDLAERWQITRERAFRRIKSSGLKSINLGTNKHPELRFRLETVESWEARVEHDPDAIAPQDAAPAAPKPPKSRAVFCPPGRLGTYQGKVK